MNLTNDKVFIDSNILIYSYSDLFPDKQAKARKLINSYDDVFISTQVLNEFVSAFVKKLKAEWPDIMNSLDEITENYSVFINTSDTVKEACKIAQKYQFSFYDSLILSSALESGCNILYSEDMQHGQLIENRLKVVNPFV
jgi:predicted nucleic acid-binding protein